MYYFYLPERVSLFDVFRVGNQIYFCVLSIGRNCIAVKYDRAETAMVIESILLIIIMLIIRSSMS